MAKVLVVDDEAICALTMREYLSDEGYEVLSAISGREALEVANRFIPDVLICDWKLGDEIDGLEVVRRVQQLNPGLRSIIISGLAFENIDSVNNPMPQIFRFLEKPCGIEEVLATLQEAIGT